MLLIVTKMKVNNYTEVVELPEGVSVSFDGKNVTVKGPKGEVTRKLYSPMVEFRADGNKVEIIIKKMRKKEKALLGTYKAHLKNMGKGVTVGHTYKLKICSGHFPMNVSYNNQLLSIKNFIGEKVPRTLDVPAGAELKVDGDIITIDSSDKELAGQLAASIEKLTKRPGFDKRIFQDGIYIIEKDGKSIE